MWWDDGGVVVMVLVWVALLILLLLVAASAAAMAMAVAAVALAKSVLWRTNEPLTTKSRFALTVAVGQQPADPPQQYRCTEWAFVTAPANTTEQRKASSERDCA